MLLHVCTKWDDMHFLLREQWKRGTSAFVIMHLQIIVFFIPTNKKFYTDVHKQEKLY